MDQPIMLVKEALNSAVQFINEGSTPTEALAKSAEYYDLNPHYIHRVGEALNVALHRSHFKKASDRSADFPIADIEKVAAEAITMNTKTASEAKSEWFPSTELSRPIPDYTKLVDSSRYQSGYQAVLKTASEARNEKFETSLPGVIKKAADYISKLKKELDAAHTEKHAANRLLESSAAALVNHFSKSAHTRLEWADIESQVFAKLGEASVPYLDLIHKTAGLKDERGFHKKGHWNFEDCPEIKMFDNLMKAAERMTVAEDAYTKAAHDYKFEKDYYNEIFHKKAEVKKKEETPVVPVVESKVAESEEIIEEDIHKLGFSILDVLMNKFQDSVEGKGQKGPNPLANSSRDNLERQTLVQELIMTDPILRRESPQKVVAAYQQILRVAPQLSKQKEVVRSMLREMMATQSLNPHTSNMYSEADINLMRQKLMAHTGAQPPKS